MQVQPGARLGPYEIVAPIGAGGMGEVYKARDIRLDRTVAIKVMSAGLADRPEWRERFEREARAISNLNHPHICTLYDVGAQDGREYLVMEYLDGETLASRLAKGPLPLDQVFRYAIEIASALDAAHRQRITHRDLKPGNIMLTRTGAKLMDFGLAKWDAPRPGAIAASVSSAPTRPAPLTSEGTILGTFNYMAPEQLEGKEADARTDLFAFGAVVYEMTTGRKAFEGTTPASVIAAILDREPTDITTVQPLTPLALKRIVRRCLAKDSDERWQSAADLRNALEELKQDHDSGQVATTTAGKLASAHRPNPRRFLAVGIIVSLLAAGASVLVWRARSRPSSAARAIEATFTRLTTQAGVESLPSLSPDGKWFVYQSGASGKSAIYLQGVGGENAINLAKDSSVADGEPAFSPDGEHIAFTSSRRAGGGLFVMGRTGEFVRRISDNRAAANPSWSPDGKELVFATESVSWNPYARGTLSELWVVKIDTGESRRISTRDAVQPNWSPHGQRIAYWGRQAPGSAQRDIFTIPAAGGPAVPVTSDAPVDWNPAWSPDGRYLYFSSDRGGSLNLWRVPINEASGEVLGPPQSITTPSPFVADLTISADGRHLAYVSMELTSNLQQVAFDPSTGKVIGTPTWITTGSRVFRSPNPAPDGDALAFSTMFQKQEDLFLSRGNGTELHPLTNDPARDRNPRWSPDGKRILFYSDRSGVWELWIMNADGTGLQQLTKRPGANGAVWSPDGTRIAFFDVNVADVFIFEVDKPWAGQELVKLPRPPPPMSIFGLIDWSPDGQKLVGGTFADGVAVYSFASQHYEQIAPALGDTGFAAWLPDSRRLLVTATGKLYVVDTVSGKPAEILSVAPDSITDVAVSHDGRRVWFARGSTEGDIWMATLK